MIVFVFLTGCLQLPNQTLRMFLLTPFSWCQLTNIVANLVHFLVLCLQLVVSCSHLRKISMRIYMRTAQDWKHTEKQFFTVLQFNVTVFKIFQHDSWLHVILILTHTHTLFRILIMSTAKLNHFFEPLLFCCACAFPLSECKVFCFYPYNLRFGFKIDKEVAGSVGSVCKDVIM